MARGRSVAAAAVSRALLAGDVQVGYVAEAHQPDRLLARVGSVTVSGGHLRRSDPCPYPG